jgi:hypothetical protein
MRKNVSKCDALPRELNSEVEESEDESKKVEEEEKSAVESRREEGN